MIGFNLAGLKYLKKEWEDNNTSDFFDMSALEKPKKKQKTRK